MGEKQLQERVGWLGLLLTNQRNNMARLMVRLRDVGLRAGGSVAIHRKFLKMLEQVEFERERELGLIHEIEAVEKKHAELRRMRRLKAADTTPQQTNKQVNDFDARPTAEPDRKLGLWVWLALWWWMMTRMRRMLSIGPSPK